MTPEPAAASHVQQSMKAGLVSRSIAAVIDIMVVALVLVAGYLSFCAALFIFRPRTFSFPTPERYWSILIGGIVIIGYLALGWYLTGRTPGKQLAGLRVVTSQGLPLNLPIAVLRAILYVAFPIGFLWSAFSSKSASAQDLLLRTSVIYDWRNHATATIPLGLTDASVVPR